MADLMIAFEITTGVFIAFGVLLFAVRGKGHRAIISGSE
jgi:hypothetical protein